MKSFIPYTVLVFFISAALFLTPAPAYAAACSYSWNGDVTISTSCAVTADTSTGPQECTGETSTSNTAQLTISNGSAITISAGVGGTTQLLTGSLIITGVNSQLIIEEGDAEHLNGSTTASTSLWVVDADADGWSPNFTTTYSATASGRRRQCLMRGTTADCNDSAYSETNTCYSYGQSYYQAYYQAYYQSYYYGYGQAYYYGYGQAYYQAYYYGYGQAYYYGYGQGYYQAYYYGYGQAYYYGYGQAYYQAYYYAYGQAYYYAYGQAYYYGYGQGYYYGYGQGYYYGYGQSSYYGYGQSWYYGYGQGSYYCFLPGTLVWMADGTYKPIDTVQEGDLVWSLNPSTSVFLKERVNAVIVHENITDTYLVINGELETTTTHPTWVNGQWKAAGEILPGDTLVGTNNQPVYVTSVEKTPQTTTHLYNLHLAGENNTYFADGILVHNK